ncbi:hypothetical protein LUZ60_005432 [Juncus effusus]|nr:hypothetical protein LUZ60_005432 [Juncus effusus]
MEESGEKKEEFVYRISTQDEWDELQKNGSTFGGDLDRKTGCFHLSDLHQVKMTLGNFFSGRNDLYLLQVNAAKIGEGLVYETADGSSYFPHLYGPNRSFIPLSLDSVVKAEKLVLDGKDFTCSLLD